MEIHPTTLTYDAYPSVYPLLESIAFMWFVIIVTVAIAVWVIAKLWHIHSIPKHVAKERDLAQAKLVFWLCLLGLVYKPLWMLAVIAIVTDWDRVQLWIKGTR